MLPNQDFNTDYELDDRYLKETGRVFLTGIQALARLPLMQARRDRAMGLNTAGFISGYRGSPLGGYDQELTRARKILLEHNVQFQPGLNENLAATAVWGTQQLAQFQGAKHDGVFGIWYGKGPGVDQASDAFRHANAFGTSKYGGVLALAGDDHGIQSSTIAHQSDQVFLGFGMPTLNPSSVAEFLELGMLGFALSRFCGLWIGFKTVTEVVESASSVSIHPMTDPFIIPDNVEMPPQGLNFDPTLRWPEERRELEVISNHLRVEAARKFAQVNKIDRITVRAEKPRLGIITTGKAYQDVLHALKELRIHEREIEEIGITIYKVGMSWPIEPKGLLEFVKDLDEVIIVEEKRAIMERQIKALLYQQSDRYRPTIIGKTDEEDRPCLPSYGELTPRMVASVIMNRIRKSAIGNDMDDKFIRILNEPPEDRIKAAPISRVPYFCSGCPHNTSTKTPEGSDAMGGIGCHIMALTMDRAKGFTHMGAEGTNWIGISPFIEADHIFQNLGDGTYEHSGLLAIRAAVSAGVNITYKILYNDAVAMTGGQPIASQLTVAAIAEQVRAEGIDKICIMSEETKAHAPHTFNFDGKIFPGLSFAHRDDLDEVQREFRTFKGVSLIIYVQTCAAEKRRRRKRGLLEDPQKRVFINDLVCDDCGDCSEQSNCVSIEPLKTELGVKRKINQSSCNKDFSCVKGFCPSFVTVNGGNLRKPDPKRFDDEEADLLTRLPKPDIKEGPEVHYNILVAGIGGTGVVTVGALLSMAAHLEGKGVSTLDFTGLAQKNGAVISHVRIAETPELLDAVRIGELSADLLLGCDMVVAGSIDALTRCDKGRTWAVINTHETPTAHFTMDTSNVLPVDATIHAVQTSIGRDRSNFLEVTSIATNLFGDAIATNLMIMGYAYQKGLIPVNGDAIEQAITLNGVSVAQNIKSFRWGRLLAHDRDAVMKRAFADKHESEPLSETLDEMIARRAKYLTAYQGKSLANRYLKLVEHARVAEQDIDTTSTALTENVARSYFKVLAYKDEYEVARLYTDKPYLEKLKSEFEGTFKLNFHMAPPILAKTNKISGERQKRQLPGSIIWPLLHMMRHGKILRGTPLDPFGYQQDRQMERRLIGEYEGLIHDVLSNLTSPNLTQAIALANLPQKIKGFGHIKMANYKTTRTEWGDLLDKFHHTETIRVAAE